MAGFEPVRASRPWPLFGLTAVAIVAVVLAVIEIGPPGGGSSRTAHEVVTAENGVVQSTVTGTGNVEAGTDLDLNFRTSGVLNSVNVTDGEHVTKGQLIATLNPTAARLALDAAEESLTSAKEQLTEVEDGTATSSTGSGSGGSSSTGASLTNPSLRTEFVSEALSAVRPPKGAGHKRPSGRKPSSGSGRSSSGSGSSSSSSGRSSSGSGSSSSGSGKPSGASSATSSSASTSTGKTSSATGATATGTSTTPSPASVASAEASVYNAEESVQTARQTLRETRLYAPVSGTIVSLSSLTPGDPISAGSNSTVATASSSSSTGATGSTGSSGTTGATSSSFAEILNTRTLTMTVALSEADITRVKVGQPATVTLDALSGVELGAHVTQISAVGTSSSGVVSYEVTLTLNQNDPQVRPGMSASASVIVGQAEGVTVPNQAVAGTGSQGTVTVVQNGKPVQKQVVVGVRGTTRTQIVSGLKSGQQVEITISLPSLGSSSSNATGSNGTLGGGAFGAGGLFRRAFGGGGFGTGVGGGGFAASGG